MRADVSPFGQRPLERVFVISADIVDDFEQVDIEIFDQLVLLDAPAFRQGRIVFGPARVSADADKLLASEVRQAVKDQLVDNFIYASVSPTYLAGVIDTL